MKKFPKDIEDFANVFVDMQFKRHKADYDPSEHFYKSAVSQDIEDTVSVIKAFESAPMKDKRAFAAYVLLKNRKD